MMDLPNQPVFVSPYRDIPGGVDYLGLREANLGLMNQFLPGINNVTREVRPFSLACWIVWAFSRQVSEQGIAAVHLSDFRAFREKAELLFNWSHALHKNDAGLFGNQQAKPDAAPSVPLTFSDWKRKVSWFDAVAYGPSLKTENGMGFLKQVHPGVFAVTKKGEELAKYLDQELNLADGYEVLASLSDNFADDAVPESLYGAWRRDDATAEEKTVFRDAFYNPDEVVKHTRLGRRSAAITLIFAALKESGGGLTASEVRRTLVTHEPAHLQESQLSELRSSRANWQVLQIRQAQRLSFEVLFGWLEWQILVNGLRTSSEIVDALLSAMEQVQPGFDPRGDISQIQAKLQFPSASDARLTEQIDAHTDLDFFSYIGQLLEAKRDDRDRAAGVAVRLLFVCSILADDLKQNEYAAGYLEQGGRFRVSLGFWSSFVMSNQRMPAADFLLVVVENFLLSQHFGFAAARYSEGKLRLRVTLEDTGLVSLLPGADKVWSPIVTQDRLVSALSLMADSGIIARNTVDGEIRYSA